MHPSPIKFPGELQQTVYGIIESLPNAKLSWQFLACAFMGSLVILSLLPLWVKPVKRYSKFLLSPWLFGTIASLAILILRLPHLVLPELNIDESQWLAGAATFWNNPRFWISVDGTTSGPLVIIPLNIINLFGGKINYATVRLLAIMLMLIPTALLVYRSLAVFFDEAYARAGALPLILVFSTLTFWDFAAYNSEHMPFTLLALALYFASRALANKNNTYHRDLLLTGFICGLVPYSKLQGAPIALSMALVVGVYFVIDSYRKKYFFQHLALYVFSGLLPTVIVLIYLLAIGAWEPFLESYILNNLAYSQQGLYGIEYSLWEKFDTTYYYLMIAANLGKFFNVKKEVLLVLMLPTIVAVFFDPKFLRPFSIAFISSFAAYFSISQPGNYFHHYFLLILPFLMFLTGTQLAATAHLISRIPILKILVKTLFLAFLFFAVLKPTLSLIRVTHPGINFVEQRHNLQISRVSERINEIVPTGQPLAIWGWANHIYIETETIQASREAHTYHQINESPQQEYYHKRYIYDLEKNKPILFVDVVGPGAFFFGDREKYGHQNFPIVRDYIQDYYRFLEEVDHFRFYVRHDPN